MNPIILFLLMLLCIGCSGRESKQTSPPPPAQSIEEPFSALPDTIVDAAYTFEEAIAGTKAPRSIINQLQLIDVYYLSVDNQIHKGQVMCHKKIADEISDLFKLMLEEQFVVEKVIPAVKYNWNDSLSMADNNSYSLLP